MSFNRAALLISTSTCFSCSSRRFDSQRHNISGGIRRPRISIDGGSTACLARSSVSKISGRVGILPHCLWIQIRVASCTCFQSPPSSFRPRRAKAMLAPAHRRYGHRGRIPYPRSTQGSGRTSSSTSSHGKARPCTLCRAILRGGTGAFDFFPVHRSGTFVQWHLVNSDDNSSSNEGDTARLDLHQLGVDDLATTVACLGWTPDIINKAGKQNPSSKHLSMLIYYQEQKRSSSRVLNYHVLHRFLRSLQPARDSL